MTIIFRAGMTSGMLLRMKALASGAGRREVLPVNDAKRAQYSCNADSAELCKEGFQEGRFRLRGGAGRRFFGAVWTGESCGAHGGKAGGRRGEGGACVQRRHAALFCVAAPNP